jgi:hypothetical protein
MSGCTEFFRDEGISSFLHPVVNKPIGALGTNYQLQTASLPQIRMDLLLGHLANDGKGGGLCGVPNARELL